MLSRTLIMLLHLYRLCVSPLLGQRCRFYPSCSNYAIEAIQTHGALRGGYLATKRLLHCHPWHPGGYDPVPNASPVAVASHCSETSCTHAPVPACSPAHSDLRKKL